MVNVVITEIKTKEVIMPGGDKTGPEGAGPLTGRRMGNCSGNSNQEMYTGFGFGRGMRNRAKREFNLSSGRGFGRNLSDSGNQNISYNETIEEEVKMLKEQLSTLEKKLEKLS